MPARTYWKGYLKLSLVTCPVAMSPATSESDKVRFHTLNRETGNRVHGGEKTIQWSACVCAGAGGVKVGHWIG